jgi:sugar-phosphatase
MAKLTATIFDMDGVLIESMPFWKQAIRENLEQVGSRFTEAAWQQTKGKPIPEVMAFFARVHPWEGPSSNEVADQVRSQVITMIRAQGELKEGVREVLSFFQEKHVPLAIASSSSMEIIDTVVDTFELRSFFDVLHTAQKEENGKPNPAVYLTAASQLGHDPHQCLVFEDSINGMIAAKAAEMTCIGLPDAENQDDPKVGIADLVLTSLADFDDDVWARLQG